MMCLFWVWIVVLYVKVLKLLNTIPKVECYRISCYNTSKGNNSQDSLNLKEAKPLGNMKRAFVASSILALNTEGGQTSSLEEAEK